MIKEENKNEHQLLLIGGYKYLYYLNEIWYYKYKEQKWNKHEQLLPTSISGYGISVTKNNEIHIFGGFNFSNWQMNNHWIIKQ